MTPEAARELTEVEGLTQRQAGEVLGVDAATVNRDVRVANATPDPADQGEPAGSVANATPDPELQAERERVAKAERDAREIEEGRERTAWTVRAAVAALGNPATLRWLPGYLAMTRPPIEQGEAAQALAALREALEGTC